MKTSRKKRIIITIVVAALAIVAAILVFDNQQKKAATETETKAEDQQTATPTDDEPGSLYDEETVRFNNVDLIKKDIPEWLINAIEKDDPVVVARTIIKKNPGDFKIRRIFNKDSTGFYCYWEGYIRKEGNRISVANGDIEIDLKDPTVNLTIPDADKLSFEFVEALIKLLWERDRKDFWTERYEHFVEVKEVPFPTEGKGITETAICVDGEFLSLFPDTAVPLSENDTYNYADTQATRSEIWYDSDGSFYKVNGSDCMVYKWEWSPSPYVDKMWRATGDVPTLQDFALPAFSYNWYLTGDRGKLTVYQPWESPESRGQFGIKPILTMEFKDINIVRPFVDYEGAESFEFAYVATPELNILWKVTPDEIGFCKLDNIEITGSRLYGKNGNEVEVLAEQVNDPYHGAWEGKFVHMIQEIRFNNLIEFKNGFKRVGISDTVRATFNNDCTIFETDEVKITIVE